MTRKNLISSRQATNDALALNRAGLVSSRVHGEHESALALFERAAQLDPHDFSSWFNIGATCRFLGHLPDAEVAWDHALELHPDDGECQLLRSQLRRQTRESNHIDELEAVLKTENLEVMTRVQLFFALAKEHEDLEDYETSFRYLTSGADLRRRHMQYDLDADLQVIDRIIETYGQVTIDKHYQVSDVGKEAIVILGMPRTGSTLVERIIGSHPKVQACGELHNFAAEVVGLCKEHIENVPDRLALVGATAKLDFQVLGQRYLDSTSNRNGDCERFTDKMPLNFLYCGLIRLALPAAKIIHVTRHPVDTIYAMYKQLFATAYPMSYDLAELARYYCAYRKLMDHWYDVCPGTIISINYDELITDQHSESRKLIEACGLDWNDSCLNFDKSGHPTTTASAAQVRQAIYTTSSGRWRSLENQLQPAIDFLQEKAIKF